MNLKKVLTLLEKYKISHTCVRMPINEHVDAACIKGCFQVRLYDYDEFMSRAGSARHVYVMSATETIIRGYIVDNISRKKNMSNIKPSQLIMLLSVHIYPDYVAEHDANKDWLINEGLIQITPPKDRGDSIYQTTEKGRAYIDHLCNQPLPVAKWTIPDAGCIHLSYDTATLTS